MLGFPNTRVYHKFYQLLSVCFLDKEASGQFLQYKWLSRHAKCGSYLNAHLTFLTHHTLVNSSPFIVIIISVFTVRLQFASWNPVSSAAWYHLVSHLTFHLFRLPLYFDSISFFLTRYHFFYWCISQKFNNQAFSSSKLFPGKRPLNKRGRSQTYTDGPEGFSCPRSRECVHAWWPCRKCFTWSDDFYSTERLFRATKCLALLKIMIF